MKNRLICDQHTLTRERGTYGPLGNVAANGCGTIALYNLYQLLEYPITYEALLEDIRRKWFLRTLAGIRLGYYWYRGQERQERQMGRHSFYLYLYGYWLGAHYAAGDARGSRLAVYNDTCRSGCLSGYYREVRAWGMLVITIDKI